METFYTFVWMVLTCLYWSMKIQWTTHYIIPLALKTFDWQTTWIRSSSLVDKYDSAEPIQVNHGTGHRDSASRLSMYGKDNTPFRSTILHIFLRLSRDESNNIKLLQIQSWLFELKCCQTPPNHERVSSQKLCIRHWMWNNLGQEHLQKTEAMDEQLVQTWYRSITCITDASSNVCVCVYTCAHMHVNNLQEISYNQLIV